jgi:hypothetical protein
MLALIGSQNSAWLFRHDGVLQRWDLKNAVRLPDRVVLDEENVTGASLPSVHSGNEHAVRYRYFLRDSERSRWI